MDSDNQQPNTEQAQTPTPPPTQYDPQNPPEWVSFRTKEVEERAKKAAIEGLVSKIGFENDQALTEFFEKAGGVDGITQLLNEHQQVMESQKTEQEKLMQAHESLQAEKETLQSQLGDLQSQLEAFKQAQIEQQREQAILNEANRSQYPKEVLRYIRDEFKDEYTSLIGDEGDINNELVQTLVNKVAEVHGAWFRASHNPGSPSSANRGFTGQSLPVTQEEVTQRAMKVRF